MQSLPYFIAEMRALGVKRLDIELDPAPPSELPTDVEAAEPPTPPKPPGSCSFGDCLQPREGLLGGAAAADLCRMHALQAAGVKS
jgi:hypothetical protein